MIHKNRSQQHPEYQAMTLFGTQDDRINIAFKYTVGVWTNKNPVAIDNARVLVRYMQELTKHNRSIMNRPGKWATTIKYFMDYMNLQELT